jgi:hypothetical protein
MNLNTKGEIQRDKLLILIGLGVLFIILIALYSQFGSKGDATLSSIFNLDFF